MSRRKKVLMIEQRSFVRHQLRVEFAQYDDIELVGMAKELVRGYELCREREPNILIIDGRMLLDDEKGFAYKMIRTNPMQLIVICDEYCHKDLVLMEDFRIGVHNLILIEKSRVTASLSEVVGAIMKYDLMFQDIAKQHVKKAEAEWLKVGEPVIAIGASTGGVSAIERILENIKCDMPPILMVQHMSGDFTKKMADRLSTISKLLVKEASHGEFIANNVAYLAPGDKHMTIETCEGRYKIVLDEGPLVHYQRPAVDRLFDSVASVMGKNSLGVLLTGMGSDGARGLLSMKESGAYTIAQDAGSSVVFSMPKAAIELGGVYEVTSIEKIGLRLEEMMGKSLQVNWNYEYV